MLSEVDGAGAGWIADANAVITTNRTLCVFASLREAIFGVHGRTIQITDGGPCVTPELSTGVAGPPFGAAHGSAILGPLARHISQNNHAVDQNSACMEKMIGRSHE